MFEIFIDIILAIIKLKVKLHAKTHIKCVTQSSIKTMLCDKQSLYQCNNKGKNKNK